MGHVTLFSDLIQKTLPVTVVRSLGHSTELIAQMLTGAIAIGGVVIAYQFYYNKSFPAAIPVRNAWQKFFFLGWDFDRVYDQLVVKPVVFFSLIDKNDVIDKFYSGVGSVTRVLNRALAATQNGRLRWYAMALAIGAVFTLTILLYS